jgi:3-isopropylmalate/(R)-2-methylmalate dehydratase large subunit
MGMTITEKILSAHAGKDEVRPGELIETGLDLVLANDITAPLAIEQFDRAGAERVFDPAKVVLVNDHFVPARDVLAAEQSKRIREFAARLKIENLFDVGQGIEHALLPEAGLIMPGDLVIGADSHTCTYGALGAFATGVGSTDLAAALITGRCWFKVPESMRLIYHGRPRAWVGGKDIILYTIGRIGVDGALYRAMEFTGPGISELSQAGRFTMCNMAIEAGAKNGIMAPDEKTMDYLKDRSSRSAEVLASDQDAEYVDTIEFDLQEVELQVAFPSSPENARPISEVNNIAIDQVVIGSCTNGWLDDLRQAAQILQGRRIKQGVRLIIIPATREIYGEALREGLLEVFHSAGAIISPPTCGPCLGGHMGVLAEGERAVATTNRNFTGRMGHQKSEVYLSGPAVAAASAILGKIAGPDELQ